MQKIAVVGDDQNGLGRERQLENTVVLKVGTVSYCIAWHDDVAS